MATSRTHSGLMLWFNNKVVDPLLIILRRGTDPKQLALFSATLGFTLGVFPICGHTIHEVAVEDCAVLSRFLIISYADLKQWTFHYWFAFPALVLDPAATLVHLRPASQWFSLEEAVSLSAACNEWRSSSSTADVPFFLISITSNSSVTIRHLKYHEACQNDGQKAKLGREKELKAALHARPKRERL